MIFHASLLGKRKKLRSAGIRSKIGYMSQKFTLYDDLTISENLDFYARLYGVPNRLRRSRKEWVLEIAGLSSRADMITRQLPGGWKQRVAFGKRAVKAALLRIECGDYGFCESCGKPINAKRLEAIPWVTQCVACQLATEDTVEIASRNGLSVSLEQSEYGTWDR